MKRIAFLGAFAIAIGISSPCGAYITEDEIRPAVTKSVHLLLASSAKWSSTQGCPSCHHQDLPMMVFNLARRRGLPVSPHALQAIVVKSLTSLGDLRDPDQLLQGSAFLDPVTGMAGRLIAARSLGLRANLSAAIVARLIARSQRADGHWMAGDDIRPPQSFSAVTNTARALRVLQIFLPKSMAKEQKARVGRARQWLARTLPQDTEERVSQMMGLRWAGGSPSLIERCRAKLLSEQRSDGGWAQTATRASDAYATGEVLAALNQAGGLTTLNSACQRGLRYLLNTQKDDGTWFVNSRLHPPGTVSPPYFETGLPYGHDQFISAMGTSWATAALLLAMPASGVAPEPVDASGAAPANFPAWAETALFGSLKELQNLVDSGWDVNAATAGGTTALMMAAPDVEKVSLLLQNGADPNTTSLTRYTALMIAASHHATDSARLLLSHGADARSSDGHPAQFGATPLMLSVFSGDVEAMQALSAKGALAKTTMLPGGIFPVTPLSVAVMRGDLPMIEAPLKTGVPVDEMAAPEGGVTSLGWAVFKNDPRLAALLLSKAPM